MDENPIQSIQYQHSPFAGDSNFRKSPMFVFYLHHFCPALSRCEMDGNGSMDPDQNRGTGSRYDPYGSYFFNPQDLYKIDGFRIFDPSVTNYIMDVHII